MTILAFTDGASRGNPGESGIGVILKDSEGKTFLTLGDYIGSATNNIAEYTALLRCLTLAEEQRCDHLIVHSDSELLVRQMEGRYKVKDAGLRSFFDRIQKKLTSAGFRFEIKHILRSENHEADELANRAINLRRLILT